MEEEDIKQIIAYALDYCQAHGTNVTTQEVYAQWAKDVEEAGVED